MCIHAYSYICVYTFISIYFNIFERIAGKMRSKMFINTHIYLYLYIFMHICKITPLYTYKLIYLSRLNPHSALMWYLGVWFFKIYANKHKYA